MSKFARLIDVLDLFSEDSTLLTAEAIADRLGISRPTAFRYVRELTEVGFLANYSGQYSLGARIITLDHRIRESDPVLSAAREPMRRLVMETGCSMVLCRMYNDDIINVHHEDGLDAGKLVLGRGRPLPLWQGAGSKAMLAHLPPQRLRKIYERHKHEPALQALGRDWPSVNAYFADIRKRGHYISYGELTPGVIGLAGPILLPQVGVIAVTSLVFVEERLKLINLQGLASELRAYSAKVAQTLTLTGEINVSGSGARPPADHPGAG